MATSWNLSPNRGLGLASNIAQGVQTFMQAYQGQQARQREFALKQQEMEGEAMLRRLQMQKLQQEVAPVMFDAQKYQVIDNAVNAGIATPKMRDDYVKQVFENADSPAKVAALNNLINQKAQRDLQGSYAAMERFGSNVQYPTSVPGGEAPVQPQQAQPQQQTTEMARQPAGQFSMTPKEAEFYGNLAKARATQQYQMAGVQQRYDVGAVNALVNMDANLKRLEANASDNETKLAIRGLIDQNNLLLQAMRGQTSERVAETQAGSRVESAKIGAGAKVAAAKVAAGARKAGARAQDDDVAKSIAKQIEQTQKTLTDLQKPPSGFSMELPGQRAASANAVRVELERLQAQYKARTGFDYKAAEEAGKAPKAAEAPKAAAGPQPVKAFSRSTPGVADELRKLPDGSKFTLDGESYRIEGGKPVKE